MTMLRILPIIIQYGIGAILCGIGIFCGIKGGYVNLKRTDDRRIIYIFIAGYLILLAFACAFTFWLPFLSEGGE